MRSIRTINVLLTQLYYRYITELRRGRSRLCRREGYVRIYIYIYIIRYPQYIIYIYIWIQHIDLKSLP